MSYANANNTSQITAGAELRYRTLKRLMKGDLSALLADRDDTERTYRSNFGIQSQRFLPNRWYVAALFRLQQNDELDLNSRTTIGGGFGRDLVQSRRSILSVFGGASLNHEDYETELEIEEDAELITGLDYSLFTFGNRETDLSLNLTIYPNLSNWGRVRSEFTMHYRHELIEDFFIDLSIYDSFDSDPPGANAEKNDYGLVTTIGWSF